MSGLYFNPTGTITNNPGGGAGSIQFNDSGSFGGFNVSGDGSLVTSTGVLTISKIGGVPVSSSYIAKTGTYTAGASDFCINCTANTFTVTLPTAVGISGKQYCVKNSGTGVITVAADGAETIDGAATKILAAQYESVLVISTGANWIII